MKAVVFDRPHNIAIRDVPRPTPSGKKVLVKVKACGLCGTDLHILEGRFIARFPLIPGHEFCGIVEEVGDEVRDIQLGQRVVIDNPFYCRTCCYCQRNQEHFCEQFRSLGVTDNGGFAEYVLVLSEQVRKISDNISFQQAIFVEPTSCAVHGVGLLKPRLGDEVLIFGSGPVGLILLQLLRVSGASKVIVAAPSAKKLELAKSLGATEVFLMERDNPGSVSEALDSIVPKGFDIVIDATGDPNVIQDCFRFVRFGGKVLIFGVPPNDSKVTINPYEIFRKEIAIFGSFAQLYDFSQALQMLESGAIRVDGLVSHTFRLDNFTEAIEIMKNSRERLKIVVIPD